MFLVVIGYRTSDIERSGRLSLIAYRQFVMNLVRAQSGINSPYDQSLWQGSEGRIPAARMRKYEENVVDMS